MKKLYLLAICLGTMISAGAQISVVKEAERAMKAEQAPAKVVEIITPAFTDPETANMAQTWFIPGKSYFKNFDKLVGIRAIKPAEADPVEMAKLLVEGYNYYKKALPLDSVADDKGKIKTKYSKEIISTIAGHHNDFTTYGIELYNVKDYDGAYNSWKIYTDIAADPTFAKMINVNDTVVGELYYNEALAAWQQDKFTDALAAFMEAKKHSYNHKVLYDQAIAVATSIPDNEAVLALAQEALPLYGNEDPMYIGQIANYYLQNKDFDNAFKFINQAIDENPDNAQYYVIRGVLYENNDNKEDAKASYDKARTIDPQNAQAVYYYGRMLVDEVYALLDNAPNDEGEYVAYFNDTVKPRLENAAEVLEQAYTLDNDNLDILKYLENVYYNLKDEAKYEEVKTRY